MSTRQSGRPHAARAEPRAESYECARAWAALASAHRLVSDAISDALASRCGLSTNAFHVLLALATAEARRLRLLELNRGIPLTQPSLTRLVDRLERQALVERADDPTDGRGILVTLTVRGHDALEQAVSVHNQCVRSFFTDHLSDDEQRILIEALTRVAATPFALPTGHQAKPVP